MWSQQEREGIDSLRGGIVYEMIAILVAFIGILSFAISLAVGVVFLILGVILAILGLIRVYRGFDKLTPYVPNTNLGKIGAILLVIPFLDLIGVILVGIALYFVGEKYNNSTVKIGGILAAIPIGFISFVGFIVTYLGLGEVNSRLTTIPAQLPQAPQTQTTQPVPQQILVYQVGNGVLRGNIATLTLNSSGQVTIIGVTIEGLNQSAMTIQPNVLMRGDNQITVTFPPLPPSPQGMQYRLRIGLADGSSILAMVTVS
jgi:Protein of unknown function (DUF973).